MARCRGAVGEAELAELAVAVDPLRRALPRDPHLRRDVRDRTALTSGDQAATTLDGQRGITVGHGRVFPIGRTSDLAVLILPPEDPSPTTQGHPHVNNLMTRNN